jgi:hypothetical protein
LPRSTNCIAAVEVMAFVMEAIQKTESVVTAGPAGRPRLPNAPA